MRIEQEESRKYTYERLWGVHLSCSPRGSLTYLKRANVYTTISIHAQMFMRQVRIILGSVRATPT